MSAAASAGGNGSASAPFNSLALVQQASGPGDTIVVEPSPNSVPPLNGGIALKPGQRLIGDGPPAAAVSTGNLGECLVVTADGANDTTVLQMIDSSFTGCDNNGFQVTSNHANGNGVGNVHTVAVNIDNSTINGSRFYNLWVNNVTPLTDLRVRVQDSDLSVSSSGVAVAFDQQPTAATASALIDLGGGALGSDGKNCIFGGAIYDLEGTQYNVSAENNWWGSAKGPTAGKVVETMPGYKIDTSSPLRRAPPACNGEGPSR